MRCSTARCRDADGRSGAAKAEPGPRRPRQRKRLPKEPFVFVGKRSVAAVAAATVAAATTAAAATRAGAVGAAETAIATTAAATTAATAAVATAAAATAATTTAVAATTAAAVATTTTASAWSTASWLSLVDAQRPTHQLCALKGFNRSLFSGFIGHFNESEAALATCVPLKRKGTIHNFTELGKQLSHIFLLSAEGKVANENTHVLRGPGTKNGPKRPGISPWAMTPKRRDIPLAFED